MTATLALYLASRPVHILHVIGLVGGGKTRFFHEYFPTLPVFDIQSVYHDHHFSSADLQSDPAAYRQFAQALEKEWDGFLIEHDPHTNIPGSFCVGVESSGINQALNVLLVPFFPSVLWIQGDPPPASETAFWVTRPYGVALNEVLRSKFAKGEVHYTHTYTVSTRQFSSSFPAEFIPFFAHSKPVQMKSGVSFPRKFRCAVCRIPFTTEALYTAHLRRHSVEEPK